MNTLALAPSCIQIVKIISGYPCTVGDRLQGNGAGREEAAKPIGRTKTGSFSPETLTICCVRACTFPTPLFQVPAYGGDTTQPLSLCGTHASSSSRSLFRSVPTLGCHVSIPLFPSHLLHYRSSVVLLVGLDLVAKLTTMTNQNQNENHEILRSPRPVVTLVQTQIRFDFDLSKCTS